MKRIANIFGVNTDLHPGTAVHSGSCTDSYKKTYGTYSPPSLSGVIYEGHEHAHSIKCFICKQPLDDPPDAP